MSFFGMDNQNILIADRAAYRTFLTRYELSISTEDDSTAKKPMSTGIMLRKAREFLNAFPDATPDILTDPIISEALISTKFQSITEFTESLESMVASGTKLNALLEFGRSINGNNKPLEQPDNADILQEYSAAEAPAPPSFSQHRHF